jgi:hypothetical protein
VKALKRNERIFWYANLSENTPPTPQYDEYGNETGEMGLTYENPKESLANISAARGTADLDAFGINANYSKTIVTADLTLPIDKSTILWIDKMPDANGEAGTVKHDYVVVGVARSINSLTIAIKEVSVS